MAASKNDHEWSKAVRLAGNRYGKNADGKKAKYLNLVADKLYAMAADGNIEAMREIGNRTDGRSVTPIQAKVEIDGALVIKWQK